MNRSEGENKTTRIQELAAEYLALQEHYDKAPDEEQRKRIQDHRNRLLAEIHVLDPNFKLESI